MVSAVPKALFLPFDIGLRPSAFGGCNSNSDKRAGRQDKPSKNVQWTFLGLGQPVGEDQRLGLRVEASCPQPGSKTPVFALS
jgi:hypothetical protein